MARSFSADLMKSYSKDLLSMIGYSSINILIACGQNDYIANVAGVQNYINTLSWSRINSWKNVKKQPWLIHS